MLSLRDVTVLWLHEGLEPASGSFKPDWPYPQSFPKQSFGDNMHAAVEYVKANMADRKRERLEPWLHAGTGQGAAVFNIQGILVIGLSLRIFP